ncbi:hypothetical protein RIF29_14726 [Crotalaria pallida]|uniref:TF-B3 domain-containing protein n=1 Tax=Crotalaria pallida TaxID=3830 RepID=A0AAN9IAK0_CROPI
MLFSHGRGSNDTNAIGFFKILPVGHLQGVEFMIIPSSFERKYKITLPNPLILRIPTGAEWKVSWIKRDYEIWFKHDWKRFALDCSLKDPHFLVFKYEGGSCFEVRIFDKNYYDIDYSSIRCTNNGATTTNHHDESVDIIDINDDSAETLENDDSGEFLESEMQTQLPKKRKTDTKRVEHRSNINQPCETKGVPARRKLNKTKIKEDLVATQQNVSAGARRGRRSMVKANSCSKAEASTKQKQSAMEKAINYQSENKNPSFICKMNLSYVTQSRLGIPRHFSKEYLAGYRVNATIGVPDEDRSWPIRINFQHSSKQSVMTGGWKRFYKEYKLKVGDVCVFERTRCKPLSFKVIIFRARDEPEELQGYGYEANQLCQDKQQRRSIQNMEKYSSGNEQVAKRKGISRSCLQTDSENSCVEKKNYKIHIRNCHLNVHPKLSQEFFNKYPTCDGKYVKLQVGGKWWPVKVLYYPNPGQGLLSAGWRAFMRQCKLKVGKIWEFNMIDEKNLVFEVSISTHRYLGF